MVAAEDKKFVTPSATCSGVQSWGDRKQSRSSHWKVTPTFTASDVNLSAPSSRIISRRCCSVNEVSGSCCSILQVMLGKEGLVGIISSRAASRAHVRCLPLSEMYLWELGAPRSPVRSFTSGLLFRPGSFPHLFYSASNILSVSTPSLRLFSSSQSYYYFE